jgi:hypothetical protein
MPTFEVICKNSTRFGLKKHRDYSLYVPESDVAKIDFYCHSCNEKPVLIRKSLPSNLILCYFGQYNRKAGIK